MTAHKSASIGAVLSSCPVELPNPFAWLNSGRFLRALAPIAGFTLVAVVLYNATTIDRVPPGFQIKLSAAAPATGLALTLTSIDVVFTERVKQDTAQNAFSITPHLDGSFHWQGSTLIFTPSDKLPLSATYKVHVAPGVQDLAGNAQSHGQDLTFTTVGPPSVTAVSPIAQTASVPVDSTIQITFDRLMDTVKVLEGLRIEPPVSYAAAWQGPVLIITPDQPLKFATEYSVRVGVPAVDTDGTPLAEFQTSFTTIGIGLDVDALIPAASVAGVSVHSPIAVVFDGPIDPNTISGAIGLTPPVSGTIKVMTLPDDRNPTAAPAQSSPSTAPSSAGNNVLVFTPDAPLAAHTTYEVSMSSGVRRTNGEAASDQSWSFTTGEPPSSALNQIVFLSDRAGVANVWLMNPDGSNQREVTAELVPVNGFDISGDGNNIAYGAAGQVKRMKIGGDGLETLTPAGAFDYAPSFTPDGTGLVVARRDPAGADQGYWSIPTLSGADPKQIAPNGAAGLGSVGLAKGGLTGQPGEPAWAPRAAFSTDGLKMLLVRGLDNAVELVDMTGTVPPVQLNLIGNSRPIWDQKDGAFYVAATPAPGSPSSLWRVSPDGTTIRMAPGAGDLSVASVDGSIVAVVVSPDGTMHLAYAPSASSPDTSAVTGQSGWNETSPSFSPDGSMVVFGRYGISDPKISGGIWVMAPDGTGVKNLATDGAYPRWTP
jgi:hypothetical protein